MSSNNISSQASGEMSASVLDFLGLPGPRPIIGSSNCIDFTEVLGAL